VTEALGSGFSGGAAYPVEWALHLSHHDLTLLVAMGPSARHLPPPVIASRVASLPEPITVTAAARIQLWHPRGQT
jgi:23S rRNA (guanine745-N1)-methyltransferase